MTIIPDITALIVSAIVVALVLVLKSQFFEPLAQAMEARDQTASEAQKDRKAAETAVEEVEARLAEALATARKDGYEEMDRVRREAAERAQQTLDGARDEARATVEAGRETLREQADRAAAELEKTAESIADDLAARVLRRAS